MRHRTSLIAAAIVTVSLAACGNSKPAYCSNRANLENSIKGLTNLNPSNGVSGLQTQLAKIQSDANSLVNSAKSDFPSQTSAISSSVNALESAVKALPANPSAGQIASVATGAANVVSAVKSFVDASSSKCG